MINFAAITKALLTQLERDATVAGFLRQSIVRGDYVNVDPNRTPWIGIYRSAVAYLPRTLGPGAENWEGTPTIKVLVQAASYKSGEDCEDLLEEYVQAVLEAVLVDVTIGATVDMIVGFDINYSYSEEVKESVFFQTAMITFNLEVATA